MLEGVVCRNTPLLKSSFIDDRKPYKAGSPIFGQQMGLIVQWLIPDEPHLTDNVRNKERNE